MLENTELQGRRPTWAQKADLLTASITTADGKLQAEQRKKFILVPIAKSVLLPRIQSVTITNEDNKFPVMGSLGDQVWHPGVEMQELPQSQRVAPTFPNAVELKTNEWIAQIFYPGYFLKANVEGAQFQSTLLAYLGLHSKRDIENYVLNGDTSSTNDLLGLQDGLRAGMVTNTYAAGGVSMSTAGETILRNMMLQLPEEIYDDVQPVNDGTGPNSPGWAFYMTRPVREAWRTRLQARGTALGDANITGRALDYDGIPLIRVPLMPGTLGVGGNESQILYSNLKGFLWGVHEDVLLETEYHKMTRSFGMVMSMRVGQSWGYEPASGVKTTGVLNS